MSYINSIKTFDPTWSVTQGLLTSPSAENSSASQRDGLRVAMLKILVIFHRNSFLRLRLKAKINQQNDPTENDPSSSAVTSTKGSDNMDLEKTHEKKKTLGWLVLDRCLVFSFGDVTFGFKVTWHTWRLESNKLRPCDFFQGVWRRLFLSRLGSENWLNWMLHPYLCMMVL